MEDDGGASRHGNAEAQYGMGSAMRSALTTSSEFVEGADKEYTETYGVEAEEDKLSLGFMQHGPYTANVGSRVFLVNGEGNTRCFT